MGACKIQAKDLVRTRRYVEKFYSMRSQLQKISLRLQTYRTNEQMMQAMKGATVALSGMNKTMNLPSLQKIAMEFERENDQMEQRQEMMDDAVDDAMDVGEEEEGDEIVEQVLEEIGVDLNQAVSNLSPVVTVNMLTTCLVRGNAEWAADAKCTACQGRTGYRGRRPRRRRFTGQTGWSEEMSSEYQLRLVRSIALRRTRLPLL